MIAQEMIDQVSDELRNISIQTKILRWLNLAQIDTAVQYIFGHLNSYGSKPTVSSNPDITLDSNFLWMKSIQIPTEQRRLYPADENVLSDSNPDYRTLVGTTSHYYINGVQLGLWQVPNSIKTITYNYQRRPAKITATVDCELPDEWHQLVTQKATTLGYNYEQNSEGSNKSLAMESKILIRLGASAYKAPDSRTVMGVETSRSSKPARPRLPSHYPSIR